MASLKWHLMKEKSFQTDDDNILFLNYWKLENRNISISNLHWTKIQHIYLKNLSLGITDFRLEDKIIKNKKKNVFSCYYKNFAATGPKTVIYIHFLLLSKNIYQTTLCKFLTKISKRPFFNLCCLYICWNFFM